MGSGSKTQQVQSSEGSGTSQSVQKAGLTADQVLAQWSGNKGSTDQWSRSSALQDVQGVLKTQAQDALQSVMPSIAKTQQTAGAYDSTTKTLMQNDANARITGQLSKTALDAVTQYGQLENQATANNNDLLKSLGSVASATGETKSQTAYENSSSGSSKSRPAFLGLFKDGGEVEDDSDELLTKFMEMTGISKYADMFSDITKDVKDGKSEEAAKSLMSEQDKKNLAFAKAGYKKIAGMFADGGELPGFGEALKPPEMQAMESANGGDSSQLMQMFVKMMMGGMADGGKIPEKSTDPEADLLTAIKKYTAGGAVRRGEADVQKGGKIQGKQSPTGEDNQVIGVAGGEGIIPKDVMEVPGVPEFLENMIKQYHTPVKTRG